MLRYRLIGCFLSITIRVPIIAERYPDVELSRGLLHPLLHVCGTGELVASCRRGQPRSRLIWNPSYLLYSPLSRPLVYDDVRRKRVGWKPLMSLHRTVEPGCLNSFSAHPGWMLPQVTRKLSVSSLKTSRQLVFVCLAGWPQQHGSEPPVVRTGQHPWLRSRWKTLSTKVGYCSNTNGGHRFRCDDISVAFTNMQPHFYRVRQVEPCHQLGWSSQALTLSILALSTMPKQQQQQQQPQQPGFEPWILGLISKRSTTVPPAVAHSVGLRSYLTDNHLLYNP